MPHQIFPLPEITYPLSIDTIGKHLALGYELHVHCHTYLCHNSARVNLVQLGRKLGRDYELSHDTLKPLFRCSKCKAAGRGSTEVSFRINPCTVPHSDVHRRYSYMSGAG